MSTVQLNFTIRTSANCKTVHLLGSWDSYRGQLPLSKDAAKTGAWKGVFKFTGQSLKPGQRYWYYYIIDGYHVSHDPARESVVEPTTGRKLNILDIPSSVPVTKTRESRRRSNSTAVAKGRSLSPSQIKCPKPVRPNESAQVRKEKFAARDIEALSAKLQAAKVDSSDSEIDSEAESDDDSEIESEVPSLTSSRSSTTSPSSVSSASSAFCTCQRYGITRAGDRVKLDCGGSRCGADSGSECSDSDVEYKTRPDTRRQAIYVRQ